MLWVLSGSLLVILVLLGFLYMMNLHLSKQESKKEEVFLSNLQFLAEMNSQLLKQNQNLFDRVQASDLPSYLAMTHSTNSSGTPSDEYVPRDDQSEFHRLADTTGLGEVMMDEASQDQDFIDMANEIGIQLKGKES